MSRVDVDKAKAGLNDPGRVYKKGCTEHVAELLGKPQKHSSQWKAGPSVGTDHSSFNPGDVVGWPPPPGKDHGHVAVFIGEPNR